MIAFAEVEIGAGGAPCCSRCRPQHPDPLPLPDTDVVDRLTRVSSDWSDGPGPNVSFVGFEPFAHPALPALIGAAASCGFERIRLRTDGGALGQHGNAAGAYAAGVRHIEFVLLGAGECHDRLTGRPGLFSAIAQGAEHFSAVSVGGSGFISALVPVCRHNVEELADTVAAAASLRCEALVLDCSALSPTESHRSLVQAALETATLNRVAASVRGLQGREPLSAPFGGPPWRLAERTP